MRKELRQKLETAARVAEFIRAHLSDDPNYAPVLGRLEEVRARARVIAARQHEGTSAARDAKAHRRELRRFLHFQLLRYLVAVGSVATRDQAELEQRFKLPNSNASNAQFLTYVQSLLETAEAQKELLIAAGMAPTLLDIIRGKVAEFEAAIETARTARRDHIGARADLEVVVGQIMDQVKVADGITRFRFGLNPEVMAEWEAVRHVPGVATGRVSPPAPATGEGEAPPAQGGVSPAA